MPVKSQLVGGYYSLFRFFPGHEPVQPLQPHPQPPPFFFFQMLLKASAAAANIIRPTAAVDTILLAANAIQTPSCFTFILIGSPPQLHRTSQSGRSLSHSKTWRRPLPLFQIQLYYKRYVRK